MAGSEASPSDPGHVAGAVEASQTAVLSVVVSELKQLAMPRFCEILAFWQMRVFRLVFLTFPEY
ncbi:MAG: hypothetical protein WCO04_19160 [Pseudomonadota bacterium]